MEPTLEQIEEHRDRLHREMEELGDFRPGMISVRFRRCGRKNCACSHPGHPGHGPQYLWNTTQGGKSRAQHLRLGPELDKASREIEEYREFRRLCRELVETNEKICRLRPVPEVADANELAALKKKLQRRFYRRRRKRSAG